jgi:hypothetical protein
MTGSVRRRAALFALLVVGILSSGAGSALAADEFEKYELESVSAELSTTQAGAHADFTSTFELTEGGGKPFAKTRDVEVVLPPGMIGNPQGIPRCTVNQLGNEPELSECPVASQVGITEVSVGGTAVSGTFIEPIYNMEPPEGTDIVARIGFYAALYPAFINVRVDPIDYSVVATIEGAPSAAGLIKASTTLWGVPADSSHDELRLTPFEAINNESPKGGRKAGLPPAPFLSNPTDCSLSRELTVTAVSYQLPDQPRTMSAPFPEITGCGKLEFAPTFTAVPTNPEAFAPTGLDTTLVIPQDETPQGNATSTMKSAVVSLPEGMTVNSAAADGLQGCSPEQVGFETSQPPACPDAAKIGSVEIEVPALEDTLNGSVYQRTPEPGHLFRFWVVTDEQGVRLKLPAEIEVNRATGQLTTVFEGIDALGGLPQVPFSELRLHVSSGPRAPLATPGCGTYWTHYSFTPWSGKPATVGDTPMQITSGCNKGGFSPQFSAGTRGASAGKYAPFTFTLTRQDGEANPQAISLHMPQGLLAKLGGVPLCPDAAAATGACPPGSRIGSLTAASGVGGAPLWIPQPGKAPTAAYLAGPYKGAPFSVVSVVPAQAGPFDLGLVVNRAAIYVDPNTALATITTDPLPQILEGVPIAYRALHVLVDRPEFTLNPTNCDPKQIRATVAATDGQVAQPSASYQATNCRNLSYTPKLKLRFTGSTKRTGNPGVKATLDLKPGQANAAAATAKLPGSLFIDNSHINNPCTRVQFNADACPATSILGTIEATTPLLDQPFKGNLYFRSNGGERELPDIVADLRGTNGIRVIQVAFIDSVKGRVRTRFLSIPDVPLSRVALTFFAGKRSLLESSENLCKTSRKANIRLVAQNGLVQKSTPVIGAKCGKGK